VGYPKVLLSFLGIETQKRSPFFFFFHSSVLIVGFKAGSKLFNFKNQGYIICLYSSLEEEHYHKKDIGHEG
jgi:hypothetical protein